MDDNVDENEFRNVLSEYYKLKKKYEGEYNKNKKQIMNNPSLSMAKKKKEISSLKKKCVNCNRVGGSIFSHLSNESNGALDRILKVKCGVVPDPCSLDIALQVANIYSLKGEVNELKSGLNYYKEKIIQLKNNMVFYMKNIDRPDVKKEFDAIKKEISEKGDNYFSYKIEINEIIDNHINKEVYNLKIEEMNSLVNQFKGLIYQYKKQGLEEEMNNITDFYLKNLIPLSKEIRNMKYHRSFVTYNSDTKQYTLDQNNYSDDFFEINLDENKVLKYVKNVYNPVNDKKIKIKINKANESLSSNPRIGSQRTDSLVEFKIQTPDEPPPGWNSTSNTENKNESNNEQNNDESIDISNDIIDLNKNPDSLDSSV